MLTTNNELERILFSYGEFNYKEYPVFNCHIGDSKFKQLLEKLSYIQENLAEVEKLYYKRVLEEEALVNNKDEKDRLRNVECIKFFYGIIDRGLGMDYFDSKKTSLLNFRTEFNSSRGNFLGCRFQLAEPHVHAYNPIMNILKETINPLTIVRLDSHQDCRESEEEAEDSTNYLSQILFDSSLTNKISKVLHTYSKFFYSPKAVCNKFRDPELEKAYGEGCAMRINGVPNIIMNIHDLPEVKEPSIIDIDVDGCEKPLSGKPGGHIYNSISDFSLRDFNEKDIVIHPRIAAGILRSRVKNPKIVLLALERGYRNRLFWHRVEKDFIEELGS